MVRGTLFSSTFVPETSTSLWVQGKSRLQLGTLRWWGAAEEEVPRVGPRAG